MLTLTPRLLPVELEEAMVMTLLAIFNLVVVAAALLLGLTLMLVAHRRQRREIERLNRQLQVFVDTSINVARCVDRLVINNGAQPDPRGAGQPVASRRWLLAEAQKRLDAGTGLEELALTLGLHKDELRLLSLVR